jgi:hypothetical protein
MRRKALTDTKKFNLLAKQKGLCYYCSNEIGSMVWYRNKPILLRAHTEHVIPFSYCQHNNSKNLVISCHICNLLKSDKIFNSLADLLEHIQNTWLKNYGGLISPCPSPKPKLVSIVKSSSPPKERRKGFAPQAADTKPITKREILSLVPIVAKPLIGVINEYIYPGESCFYPKHGELTFEENVLMKLGCPELIDYFQRMK